MKAGGESIGQGPLALRVSLQPHPHRTHISLQLTFVHLAQRTTTGSSRHSAEERWTHYNVIFELATALLQYGAPSHRIEVIVSAIGSSLSIQTAFYYLPSYAIIQFPTLSSSGSVNGPSSLYFIKSRGSMNFHKLPQVYELVKDILRDGVGCDEIRFRLEKIRSAEEKAKEFPEWLIALSYPFAAMTSAVMFFHGSWEDALVSGALGLIPGLLRLVANKFETLWVSRGIPFPLSTHW